MPRRNTPRHGRPGRNRSHRSAAERQSAGREEYRARRADERAASVVVCVNGKRGWPEHIAREKLAKYGNSNRPNRPVRVYQCEKCGSWHLTSLAEPPRRLNGES